LEAQSSASIRRPKAQALFFPLGRKIVGKGGKKREHSPTPERVSKKLRGSTLFWQGPFESEKSGGGRYNASHHGLSAASRNIIEGGREVTPPR